MNMTLQELEELFEKIKECVIFYERNYLYNKTYSLFLGNGEKINYSIPAKCLPHLLGIKDLNMLTNCSCFTGDNVLEILKELPNKAYDIQQKIKNGIINVDIALSKHINEKLEGFKENFKYNINDMVAETEFVCNYKSERSWQHTTKNDKCNYVIVKKLPDDRICILTLVKNNSQYYAMSNQLYKNLDEATTTLNNLIKNQEITLLTGLTVYNEYSDNNFTSHLFINQKLKKIDDMKFYKNKFDCFIDISEDYGYTIETLRKSKTEKFANNSTIDDIVKAIVQGGLIDRNPHCDSTLISIIDAWNDYICSNPSNNEKVSVSYSEAIENLTKVRQLADRLQKENNELKEEVTELKSNNQALTEENEQYNEREKAIIKILKPEN